MIVEPVTDNSKIKSISEMYNIRPDLVQSIINVYFALSMYNMVLYKRDKNLFGTMALDDNYVIHMIKNSELFEKIKTGDIKPEEFLEYIIHGTRRP